MNFKFQIALFCLCMIMAHHMLGQKKYHLPDGVKDSIVVVKDDTTIIKHFKEVTYFPLLKNSEIKDMKRYLFLKRKVHKVYHYARIASDSLLIIQGRLDELKKKRKKRKEIKKIQRFIEKDLKPKLKKLTQTDGRILSKLINRETGVTVYQILKTYKSGWSAFWWNAKANIFKISLKDEYDPENNEEDRLIEDILNKAFTNGTLIEFEKTDWSKIRYN